MIQWRSGREIAYVPGPRGADKGAEIVQNIFSGKQFKSGAWQYGGTCTCPVYGICRTDKQKLKENTNLGVIAPSEIVVAPRVFRSCKANECLCREHVTSYPCVILCFFLLQKVGRAPPPHAPLIRPC